MALTFDPLRWPDDAEAVIDFLCAGEWPFHRSPHLTPEEATSVRVAGDDVVTFWIRLDGTTVGIVRVFDLDDISDGSPLFDVRIAESYRGQGIGGEAVRWLTDHLFTTYPALRRIEATTRHDNVAMQAVLDRCGFQLEGRMREAWPSDDGTRFDSLVYAILRREWTANR